MFAHLQDIAEQAKDDDWHSDVVLVNPRLERCRDVALRDALDAKARKIVELSSSTPYVQIPDVPCVKRRLGHFRGQLAFHIDVSGRQRADQVKRKTGSLMKRRPNIETKGAERCTAK